METLWYILLAWVLANYVVLDGMDFGVGMMVLPIGKTRAEREEILRSIGPVWDGNEVWLLVTGGTMFLAFPSLLATALRGFYLPLMIVLWLLVFRALGIQMRHQFHHPLWEQFWEVAFATSSLLLALFFGAALGNLLRGVPLDGSGNFFEPLWTDFRVGATTGILDWYTLLVGGTSVLALAFHGSLWIAFHSRGVVRKRAASWAQGLGILLLLFSVLSTFASFEVQPFLRDHAQQRVWGFVFPGVSLVSLIAALFSSRQGAFGRAFLASSLFLYGILATVAVSLYPFVLPARETSLGLTASQAAAGAYGLRVALHWWIPGVLLACGYFLFVYSRMFRPQGGLESEEITAPHKQ